MKKTIFIIVSLMMYSTINAQLSCNEIRDALQERGGPSYTIVSGIGIDSKTTADDDILSIGFQTYAKSKGDPYNFDEYYYAWVIFKDKPFKQYIYQVKEFTSQYYSAEYLNSNLTQAFWKHIHPHNNTLECGVIVTHD